MPTVNQMVRKGRKDKKSKSKAPALQFTLNSYKQRRFRQDKIDGALDLQTLALVAEVERIADLESREVLLAKLAGAMKGNLAKAAGLFNAPASQVARLAAALQQKKSGEESAA